MGRESEGAALREAFHRWAEGTAYTHEHFSYVEPGKFVGHVPAEEHRTAEALVMDGVPRLFAEVDLLREAVEMLTCDALWDDLPDNVQQWFWSWKDRLRLLNDRPGRPSDG